MHSHERQVARPIIAHVDLDAFYTQVEVKRNPALQGKPVAVVQYNPFGDLRTIDASEPRIFNESNGSLIAVSYEARACGVKRSMRGDEARRICPDLQLVQVPTANGKADITIYRDAGATVIDILARGGVCERASIDEAYLDITQEASRRLAQCQGRPPLPVKAEECFVYGSSTKWNYQTWLETSDWVLSEADALLACGAVVVAELRHAVYTELGFTCSAGIAHNKLLAKLCSGLNKPSKQTILPEGSVQSLLDPLPLSKLRSLGGKFGQNVSKVLGIETVGQLAAIPQSRLEALFGLETGAWLHSIAHGIHSEKVTQRMLPKSLACSKTFRGQHVIRSLEDVKRWLLQMANELSERIGCEQAKNQRTPQTMGVGMTSPDQHVSRSCSLKSTDAASIASAASSLVRRWASEQKDLNIIGLSICAFNFQDRPAIAPITSFFQRTTAALSENTSAPSNDMQRNDPEDPTGETDKGMDDDIEEMGEEMGFFAAEYDDGPPDFPPLTSEPSSLPPFGLAPAVDVSPDDNVRGMPLITSTGAPDNACGSTQPSQPMKPHYQHLTAADISMEVLQELPADIREDVLNSLREPSSTTKQQTVVDRKRGRPSSKHSKPEGPTSKRQSSIAKFAVPKSRLSL